LVYDYASALKLSRHILKFHFLALAIRAATSWSKVWVYNLGIFGTFAHICHFYRLRNTGNYPMSKERILILDGEANTQWTLKAMLESEDYAVIAANSIDQALEKFAETELSGLITEYRINNSLTLPMVRKFKDAFPEAYVMMLSYGEVKENEYEQILKAGADDFFQKPLSFKKVLLHLQKGLKNRLNLLMKRKMSDDLRIDGSQGFVGEETISPKHRSPV